MAKKELEEKLISQLTVELEPVHLSIENVSDDCGVKLNIIIVSRKFEGLPTLAQHRLVNKVIEQEREEIHAITLKTYTPEKWQGMIQQNETKSEI